MHTLTLNIKNNAYDKIAYFLKNLSDDIEIINHNVTDDINEEKKTPANLRGVFNKYADNSIIDQENNAWKNHITNINS